MWTPPERVRHPISETQWPSAEQAAASRWFSPIVVGPLRLMTRTWVPAMVPWRATEDGFVSDEVLDWYRRFAEGRPGALVVEATGIRDVPSGPLLRIGDDRFVPGLMRLAQTVRDASLGETRLFIQLIDFLPVKRRPQPDTFLRRFLVLDDHHRSKIAAARHDPGLRQADEETLRDLLIAGDDALLDAVLRPRELRDLRYGLRVDIGDLDRPEVRALPQQLPGLFAAAAHRAEAAGFDGVELHYAHAYTMASFLSRTNNRDDGYGGSLEARLRLPMEVLAKVRAATSRGLALGCRMLGDEVIEGGSTLDDTITYARAFAAVGIDFLSISKGGRFDDAKQPAIGASIYPYTGRSGYECIPTVYSDSRGPFGRNVPLAAAIRSAIRSDGGSTPVITAGGIHSFEQAEAILDRGEADIVAAARQSLADPDWFNKIRSGHGAMIRRCKYTNYCEALDTKHKQVTCQLWDREAIDVPETRLSKDGRRRLTAPPWTPPEADD